MSGEVALRCTACGEPLLPEDRFCEHCGARAADNPIEAEASTDGCLGCAAPRSAIDDDGYCTVCGLRERMPGARTELDLVVAGAVSDQGRVHRTNEDAFHVECVDGGIVAVVCDGISTSASADLAARAAASGAGRILAAAVADDDAELEQAMREAMAAARRLVGELPAPAPGEGELPSCTLVAAAIRGDEIVVGSAGDSRAYWIAAGEARQLTVDDSWAAEQVADGLLSAEEASADPRAHSITHWVGPDAPEEPPAVTRLRVSTSGLLALCSDGLWNYVPDAAAMAALLGALPAGASAVAAARALADIALERGGHDNITVVLVEVRAPGEASG